MDSAQQLTRWVKQAQVDMVLTCDELLLLPLRTTVCVGAWEDRPQGRVCIRAFPNDKHPTPSRGALASSTRFSARPRPPWEEEPRGGVILEILLHNC